MAGSPRDWTAQDVGVWLEQLQLGQWRALFEDNDICGVSLGMLDDEGLVSLGVDNVADRATVLSNARKILGKPTTGSKIPRSSSANFLEIDAGSKSLGARSTSDSSLPRKASFDLGTLAEGLSGLEVHVGHKATLRGWLMKQSGTVVKRWNKRFFVLCSSTLLYAKTTDATSPLGVINLDEYVLSKVSSRKRSFSLSVMSGQVKKKKCDKEYTLKAPDDAMYKSWVESLSSAAKFFFVAEGHTKKAMPSRVVLRLIAQHKFPPECGDFIREGLMKKSPAKPTNFGRWHTRHFFLFSRKLIYGAPAGNDVKIKGVIDLANAMLKDGTTTEGVENGFTIVARGGFYQLEAPYDERKYWIRDILAAIDALLVEKRGDEPTTPTRNSLTLDKRSAKMFDTSSSPGNDGSVLSTEERPASTSSVHSLNASEVHSMNTSTSNEEGGKARSKSVRSQLHLDKNFPKAPMPNCVRFGSYHIVPPVPEHDPLYSWGARCQLLAPALRYHSCDVIGFQGVCPEDLTGLITDMRDYGVVLGAVDDDSGGPGSIAAHEHTLGLIYFKWRLLLTRADVVPVMVGDQELWVQYASFQDVFTENTFFIFNTMIADDCVDASIAPLKDFVTTTAGETPFVLTISAELKSSAFEQMTATYELNGKEVFFEDMGYTNGGMMHQHVGGAQTYWDPSGAGEVRDFIFGKTGEVESMQSGCPNDFINENGRSSLHSLLIGDLIVFVG